MHDARKNSKETRMEKNFLTEYGIGLSDILDTMFVGYKVPSYSETNQRSYGESGGDALYPAWGNNDLGRGYACAYVPKSHSLVRTTEGIKAFRLQPRYELRSGRDTLVGWDAALEVSFDELIFSDAVQRQLRKWTCAHTNVQADSLRIEWCQDCGLEDPHGKEVIL
jgi:hypothetical protein